jgi:AraC-like DNA-binding protein
MSLEVQYYAPDQDISWIVKQFETIHFDGDGEVTDKFIPREDISLVFHFNDPPTMTCPIYKKLPNYFIAPVSSKASVMRLTKANEVFIVTCKPTVFSRVFNISLAAVPTIFIQLPQSVFYPLWENLSKSRNTGERVNCVSQFLHDFHPEPYLPDITDLFYDKIIESGIDKKVHELIDDLPVSERTLQRMFQRRVGVSPKALLRIFRINYLWKKIKNKQPVDYHSLVYEGNFFDQAHFIKDFKAITGETPDFFFKRNLQNVKILSGRKLDYIQ